VRDRFNAANALLRSAVGEIRWTVSPACKRLISYMASFAWEHMKTKHKGMSHLVDAATYPVAKLFPIRRRDGQRPLV
jgi:hypothetical protein